MNILINNVKDTLGEFQFDQINCYERPAAIVYHYTNPGIENLYLMYRKLRETYQIHIDSNELANLESELGIRCIKLYAKDSLIESITQLLNQGYPVLVPGNLKYLYYTNHYKKEDWGHIFLIRGYDETREIFYILDSMQQPNQNDYPIYDNFSMTYQQLTTLFEMYNGHDIHCIFHFYPLSDGICYERRLIDFLQLFIKAIKERSYIENDILLQLSHSTITLQQAKQSLLNIPKYKLILLQLIIDSMNQYHYNTDTFTQLNNDLQSLWTTDTLNFIRHSLSSDLVNRNNISSSKSQLLETNLEKELENYLDFLLHLSSSKKLEILPLPCENNIDNIIHYKDEHYYFSIHTGNTYNTWLSDDCPKIITYKNLHDVHELYFEITYSIKTDTPQTGYQAGLYFRTNTDEMYTFAMDHTNSLLFDNVGKFNIESFSQEYNTEEIHLYIKKEDSSFSIGFITENNTPVELKQFTINVIITQAGLFCKTWNNCKDLDVIFNNYKIEYNE